MAFDRPTLEYIIDRIKSDFETRIEGASSLLRRSTLSIMSKVYGGAVHLLYGFLNTISTNLFAFSAIGSRLEDIGEEFGITRKAAVKATGSAETDGTSINGTTIPEDTELISIAGQVYVTTEDAVVASGTATLSLEAQEAGADGNDDPGISLSFVSPIAGVSSTATVDSDGLDGGSDEESDSLLRERILARKRLPPHGGADFDYVAWAKEVSGVTRAWSFPQYQGVGTIGVAFVRDDDLSIVPDADDRDEVREYIIEHEDPASGETVGIPVTAEPGLFILELTLLTVNFEINLNPNTSEVQANVESELEDLILRDGGPGETLRLSRISEAISLAIGENYHSLIIPSSDVTATANQVHVLGTITFNDA